MADQDSLHDIAQIRATLWAAGFRPVPVYSFNSSHPSAGKAPIGRDWTGIARLNPPPCVTAPARSDAANTGVLCDGLRAIDVDIDDPARAAAVAALAEAMFGPTVRKYRSNSPRCTLIYRAAEGAPSKRVMKGAGHSKANSNQIEALGLGQQFVGYGKHPSGALIEWAPRPLHAVTLADLPAITEDDLTAFFAAAAPIIGADIPAPRYDPPREQRAASRYEYAPGDDADLFAALDHIPNPGLGWDYWLRIGLATYRATGGSASGKAAWNAWSAKSSAHDPKFTERTWRGFHKTPPSSIGAGTIFYEAGRNGWERPKSVKQTIVTAKTDPVSGLPIFDAWKLERIELNGTTQEQWLKQLGERQTRRKQLKRPIA